MVDEKQMNIAEKVRKLIDKANSTPYEEEKLAFFKKADELMALHSIEEFMIQMSRPAHERRKPELRDVPFIYQEGDANSEHFWRVSINMLSALAHHCRVKVGDWGTGARPVKMVGYTDDLNYLEMLYTSVMLQFSRSLTPSADPRKSIGENVADLKEAGYKWDEIYFKLMAAEMVPTIRRFEYGRDTGAPLFRAYKKFLADHPERQHVKSNPKAWAEGFTRGFIDQVSRRLYAMNRATAEATTGKGLVLAGMEDELLAMLWEHFPNLRPHDPACQCERCKPVSAPGLVRRGGRTRAYKEIAYDVRAVAAGRASGDKADLSGGKTMDQRKALGDG